MKIFQRPEYAFFREGVQQIYSQLSLEDLLLMLSTMTEDEKSQTYIYHPSWSSWRLAQDVPEVSKAQFVFQRNVKAPAPSIAAQEGAGLHRLAPSPAQNMPLSQSGEFVFPPNLKFDVTLPFVPEYKGSLVKVHLPFVTLSNDCPLPPRKEFELHLKSLSYIFTLQGQLTNAENRKLVLLTHGPNLVYFSDLLKLLQK